MGDHDGYIRYSPKELKKQKSLYKVLTPIVLNPHINSYELMGAHDAYMRHCL